MAEDIFFHVFAFKLHAATRFLEFLIRLLQYAIAEWTYIVLAFGVNISTVVTIGNIYGSHNCITSLYNYIIIIGDTKTL